MHKAYKEKYKEIKDYYHYLTHDRSKESLGHNNELILDNFYLVKEFNAYLKNFNLNRDLKSTKGIFILINDILENNNYHLKFNTLCNDINDYQKRNKLYFNFKQVTLIPLITRLILFNRLYLLVSEEQNNLRKKVEAESLIKQIESEKMASDYFDKELYLEGDKLLLKHPELLLDMNYNLGENGDLSNEIFAEINEVAIKERLNIKELIKKATDRKALNNLLLNGIITSFKELNQHNTYDFINALSMSEEELNKDNLYKDMDEKAKISYRKKIIKRKDKKDELSYVKELVSKSLKEDKHLGFYLFKDINYKLRFITYIILTIMLTIILDSFLSIYLFKSFILSFILLLVPLFDISSKIINNILKILYKDETLFKMAYQEIPDDSRTMLLLESDNLGEAFIKIEDLYNTYNDDNIIYTVLTSQNDKEYLKLANSLNKKYKTKFFFFVSLRDNNINNFNNLLKGNLDKEEILLSNLNKLKEDVKYVIALKGQELDKEAIYDLINTISHPLNKNYRSISFKEIVNPSFTIFNENKVSGSFIYDLKAFNDITKKNNSLSTYYPVNNLSNYLKKLSSQKESLSNLSNLNFINKFKHLKAFIDIFLPIIYLLIFMLSFYLAKYHLAISLSVLLFINVINMLYEYKRVTLIRELLMLPYKAFLSIYIFFNNKDYMTRLKLFIPSIVVGLVLIISYLLKYTKSKGSLVFGAIFILSSFLIKSLGKEKVKIKTPKEDTPSKELPVKESAQDIKTYSTNENPCLNLLSSGRYSSIMNTYGNGYASFKDIKINRYNEIEENDYGFYLYVKDKKKKEVFSTTYAPLYEGKEKYQTIFSDSSSKFIRKDEDITSETSIYVLEEDAEIRKVTFTNNSSKEKDLELSSYMELDLGKNNNIFLSNEFNKDLKAIIARNSSDNACFFGHLIAGIDGPVTYLTERDKFIGRGNSLRNPKALSIKYDNVAGDSYDPILSLRTSIKIKPGAKKTIYLVYAYSEKREVLLKRLEGLEKLSTIEEYINYASVKKNLKLKSLGINKKKIALYNSLFNYLYQASRYLNNSERSKILMQNTLTKKYLVRRGITGNNPLILVDIKSIMEIDMLSDMIKAYEYLKLNNMHVDLVIVNKEEKKYQHIIDVTIEQEIYRINTLFSFNETPGNIYLIDNNDLSKEEETLLKVLSRINFLDSDVKTLEDAIASLYRDNPLKEVKIRDYPLINRYSKNEELEFFNGFGGFKDNSYIITSNNTPSPWSNILEGKNLGSLITNNGCGYTYFSDPSLFKISMWDEDKIINNPGEKIIINDEYLEPVRSEHSFGFSKFLYEGSNYNLEVLEFLSKEESIKLFKAKLIAKTDDTYNIKFLLKPVLGTSIEETSRYLLTEYNPEIDALIITNKTSEHFKDINVYLAGSLALSGYSLNKMNEKTVSSEITLKEKETKDFVFMLGATKESSRIEEIITKYRMKAVVDKAFKEVTNYYKEILGRIKVTTPDEALNKMLNGFYLYSALINNEKSFSLRLIRAMNLVLIDSNILREEILKAASHQFREGDCLSYYQEEIKYGLRTRKKDDYLWLIYAICRYIEVTGDFDLLDERVPFINGPILDDFEHEKAFTYSYTLDTSTIYSRLILGLNKAIKNLGRNNLPLIGGGDFTYGFNKVGIKGRGTSVWLAFFIKIITQKALVIMDFEGDERCSQYEEVLKTLEKAINEWAYEDNYYLRAFFDNGAKIGSKSSKEAKIDLMSTSFASLSDMPKEKVTSSINEALKELVDDKNKLVKLLTPPFNISRNNPGLIASLPEGFRENGGEDNIISTFFMKALIKEGKINEAYQIFNYMNPLNRTLSKETVNKYKLEPYTLPRYIFTNKHYLGMGDTSWSAASSSILYYEALTSLLGLSKKGDKLYINPNFPKGWKEYSISYKYLDTLYDIKIKKASKNGIKYDTKVIKERYILLKNDWKKHSVIISYKEKK